MVVFKITLFLFSSSHESPYESKSSLTLSDIESKLSQMDIHKHIHAIHKNNTMV